MTQAEAIDRARAFLASVSDRNLKRIDLHDIWRKFDLGAVAIEPLLLSERLKRGHITLADLTPPQRRAVVDPATLDLHALAAGPIMDSNELYLPAGKISLAEAKAREQASILEARP